MDESARTEAWRSRVNAIGPGETARFQLERNGKAVAAFIVNHDGRHYVYVNRCPHAGTPLDLWPNEFFTEDGRFLVCATHGAIFDPSTGICVEGPCPGARLEPLRLERDGEFLVVTCPS